MLLAAVLGAGMVLAGSAAGAGQGEPPPPPEEIAPPPAQTQPPPATIPDDPPEPPPTTITLIVPAPPAVKPKRVAAKQAPSAEPAPAKRYRPRRTRSYAEPPAEPAATPAATPKPTVKPKRKPKPARPAKRAPAASPLHVAPQYQAVVRDSIRAGGVLGAQFPPQVVASSPPDRRAEYLLILLAVGGSILLAIAGAAPRLAWYWPEIFVPVIDATERIVLAGVCLAGAALTLAITWALTGPGA